MEKALYGMSSHKGFFNMCAICIVPIIKKSCVDMFFNKTRLFFSKKNEITQCCTMHKICVQTNQKYHYMFDIFFCFGSKIIAFQVEIAMFSTYIF